MIRDYQDLAMAIEEEDSEAPRMKAPPKLPQSQTWARRVFRSRAPGSNPAGFEFHPHHLGYGLWSQGHNYNTQLKETQDSISSLNKTVGKHIAKFQVKEEEAETKIMELEGKVKELIVQAHSGATHLLNQLRELRKNNLDLHCEFQDFKLNRTDRKEACCPKGWDAFRKSCYWENREPKSWQEAKTECESYDAHLVIISSYEEQQFVQVRARPNFMWIGLTDSSGSWKWVDGSSYTVVSRDWCPEQPDNWYGHELGGGEDCAHLHRNGCWNDDHCSRLYGSVCEMEMDM